MAELMESLESNGIAVDAETIRRGIVNENMPKHMTIIARDYKEDVN